MQPGWRKLYPAPTRYVPHRVPAAEYLDDPGIPEVHRAGSYRDLERIGLIPFQFSPLWRACRSLLCRRREISKGRDARGNRLHGPPAGENAPPRLLELGAGTGHTSDRIEAAARREGLPVELVRTDRDPPKPHVERLDWLLSPLPSCDVAFSNLVLHHFTHDNAVLALRKMHEASRLGGVVYDLNRSRFAFETLRWMLPLVVASPVTVADALISVQQAFTPRELLDLAADAGISRPRVSVQGFGFRTLLWWERA